MKKVKFLPATPWKNSEIKRIMESNSSAIRVWAEISSWKKIIQYLVLSCFVTGKGNEMTSYVQGAVNRLMSVSVKPPIRVASWSSVVLRI